MIADPEQRALAAFLARSAPAAPVDAEGWITLRAEALGAALSLSADLLLGVDADAVVTLVSPRAAAFFPRELQGLPAREALSYAALEALVGGEPEPEELLARGGARRAIRWRAVPTGEGPLPALLLGQDVTDVQRATTRLGNRVQRLEAMHAISLALGQGEDLGELYGMGLSRLADLVPLIFGALYRLSGDRGAPDEARLVGVVAWSQGEGRTLDEALPLDAHPASEAILQRAPVLMSTSGSSALAWPQLQLLGRQGVRTVAAVPLLEESRALGVLWLGTARPQGFSAEDLDAAQELAGLLVNAMVRQRLMDRIAGHTRELEARVAARTSELESTREQLLAAARLSSIGELSAGVAHELNQPLNVITGYLELLQDGELGPDEAAHAIDVMAKAADRMAGLVRHLRDFSRAGVETLRAVDLRQVLDMARELTARATKRPIEVRWQRPAEPVMVLGDPGRLEQLFINLLANAMQATEQHGGVKVSLRALRAGGDLHVEVEDEGSGVPPHLRGRIFEPFFTTKERGQGTGLGLSISAKIVSEHQGRIEVGDGARGAVFRVILPSYRMA